MKRTAALALLLLSGCAGFPEWEHWPRAVDGLAPVSGCWEGSWISDENGHHGTLRCIVSRAEAGSPNSAYTAHYYATYGWSIFSFSFDYVLPMSVVPDDGGWKFRGGAELGCWIAGGLYEYEGRADLETFVASYNSGFDHGVFRMKRVH